VFVAFHTGLLTKKEKNELYCVLQAREVLGGASGQTQRYQQHPYELVAFVTKDRLRDPNMPWNYIEPLMRAPDPAIFYDDPLDLVYDAHAALDVDASFWEQLDVFAEESFELAVFAKNIGERGDQSSRKNLQVGSEASCFDVYEIIRASATGGDAHGPSFDIHRSRKL
jgi:hypothetical protein